MFIGKPLLHYYFSKKLFQKKFGRNKKAFTFAVRLENDGKKSGKMLVFQR